LIEPIIKQLRVTGRIDRGWLGVSVQDADEGVTVAGVERTSPAGRAGIHQGDIILAVNGDHIDSSRGLIRTIAAVAPGSAVKLSVRRKGHDMDVSVTVGRRPSESTAEEAK
jgi:serine protease Do